MTLYTVKGKKMVDYWTIIHWAFFAFLGSSVAAWKEPPLWVHLTYTICISYAWEIAEHFLQRTYTDAWSNRIEPWSNAWIGDPISNLLGVAFGWFVVAYYRKHWWIWSRQ